MGNMENRDFEGFGRLKAFLSLHLSDKIDNEMYFGTLPRAMLTPRARAQGSTIDDYI